MSKPNQLSGSRSKSSLLAVGLWLLTHTALGQNAHYSYDLSGNLAASTNVSPSLAIVGQPATQLIQTGENSTFSVTIPNGASVLYQWQFNGANIAGATNDSLILRNLSSTNLGSYTVIVSNALGVVTSTVAMLQLDADRDGLPDSWETTYFTNLSLGGLQDFDGDGVSNLDEFREGTNPANASSHTPRLAITTIQSSAVAAPNLSKYTNGQNVIVTATPDPGLSFIGWFGSVSSANNPLSLTMDGSQSLVALSGLPLGQSLDANEVWTTGGAIGWFGQTNVTSDGIDAAQSGPIDANQESWLETTLTMTNPGAISFLWKADTETDTFTGASLDFATFSINGVAQPERFGGLNTFWTDETYALPAGTNTLRWTYLKNSKDEQFNVYFTDHVWLDRVSITNYPNPNLDSDSDGLPDLWEFTYWRQLYLANSRGDNDNDSVSNLEEYLDGTNPTDPASVMPRLTIFNFGGTTLRSPDLPKYAYNQSVTVTATNGAPGTTFFGWAGDVLGTTNPSTLTMDRGRTVAAIFGLSLSNAVDRADFNPVFSGQIGWFGQTNVTHDGVDAAQSGPLFGFNTASRMDATFLGAGTLTLWAKVVGVNNALHFYLNGSGYPDSIPRFYGDTNWQQKTFFLGAGTNVFRWEYVISYLPNIDPTNASWVDQVSFVPGPTSPVITGQPLSRTVGLGGNVVFSVAVIGTPPLSYQWKRNGSDISGGTNISLTLSGVTTNQAGTYSVVVGSPAGSTNSQNAALTVISAPPANDNFASRVALSDPTNSTSGHNVLATKELGEPNHTGYPGGKSVWWTWTAPGNGAVQISAASIDFNSNLLLALYTGNALSALTNVASSLGGGVSTNGTTIYRSQVTAAVKAGTAYQIAVDGYNGANGAIALDVVFIPAPVNDDFVNRIPLGSSTNVPVSALNLWATKEIGEPNHAASVGGKSVWWSWTAPLSGQGKVSFSSTNFSGSMLVGVYTGNSVSALTEEGSGYASGVFTNGGYVYNGEALFNITAGTTYQVAVDGGFGVSGNFDFNIQTVSAPSNDNFVNRIVLSGATNVVNGSNFAASWEAGETAHVQDYTGGRSVWWSWTAPTNGLLKMRVPTNNFGSTLLLAVYTGSTIPTLVSVTNTAGRTVFTNSTFITVYDIRFNVTAGTTYQIVVDGDSGASGNFTLITEFLPTPPGNDNFANRTVLSGISNSFGAYNLGATKEFREPNHTFFNSSNSVWWTWTAPSNGSAMISIPWSDFGNYVLLAVYRGTTVSNLISVGSSFGNSAFTNLTFTYVNQLIFNATAGTNYQIALDGNSGAAGEFQMSVAMMTTPLITLQPQNQAVVTNSTVNLSVVAAGAPPLSYEWRFNGNRIGNATNAAYSFSNAATNQSGAYSVVVSNSYGSVTSLVATVTVYIPLPLPESLDATSLVWTTGGNANWIGQPATTHDGIDAGQTGAIGDNQETWVATTVAGPGTLTFWWKVSSASSDYLEFYLGGVLQSGRISSAVDWQQKTFTIPTGSQTLRWRYVKDASFSFGQDRGWVDEVLYAGSQPDLGSPQILGNGNFQFTLTREAGRTYNIEASTNLVNWGVWISLFNTNGTILITDTNVPGNHHRFYRSRLAP